MIITHRLYIGNFAPIKFLHLIKVLPLSAPPPKTIYVVIIQQIEVFMGEIFGGEGFPSSEFWGWVKTGMDLQVEILHREIGQKWYTKLFKNNTHDCPQDLCSSDQKKRKKKRHYFKIYLRVWGIFFKRITFFLLLFHTILWATELLGV